MFNKKFPFYKQLDSTDCGPTCLKMISKYYGKELSHEYLRNITGLTKEGVSVLSITTAAEKIGLETLVANVDYDTLINEAPLPCIVYWRQRHFIIVYKIEKNIVYVADPDYGLIKYSKEDFIKGWTGNDFSTNGSNNGILILFEPTKTFFEKNFETDKEAESFTTNIISYLIPYKKYIYQIFIGFIIISFIQLSFPFLTQSVIDKGVYFGNIHFIVIVLIAQLILFITQSLVYVVQNWLLMYISSRINLNISNEFIQKLLRLPIRFFDSSSQGEILQKLQDTDRIEKYIMSFPMTIFSIFNLIIFSVILLYFNYIIFLTFFLFSIIYIVWIILFLKKRKEIEFKRFDWKFQ